MGLSPEERRRIYDEEKVRIEAQETIGKKKRMKVGSTTSLNTNVAGLLCYLGFWVNGIIFLFIEKKDRLVRFHAMQSLVTLGIIHIIWGVASSFVGWPWALGWWGRGFLNPVSIAATVVVIVFFALWWILWGILMYKAYHGTPFRIGAFSDLAEKCLAKLDAEK